MRLKSLLLYLPAFIAVLLALLLEFWLVKVQPEVLFLANWSYQPGQVQDALPPTPKKAGTSTPMRLSLTARPAVAWFQTELPASTHAQVVYVRGLAENSRVFLNQTLIHDFDWQPTLSPMPYPGWRYQWIPIPPGPAGRQLSFQIYSTRWHLGIQGLPYLAPQETAVKKMVLQDLMHLLIGGGTLLLGIGLLMGLGLSIRVDILIMSTFALLAGASIIARTDLIQWLMPAPLFWQPFETTAYQCITWLWTLFLLRRVQSPLQSMLRLLLGIQSLWILGSLLWYLSEPRALEYSFNLYIPLSMAYMACFWLFLLAAWRAQPGRIRRPLLIAMTGMLIQNLITLHDILMYWRLLPWHHWILHWSNLILMLTGMALLLDHLHHISLSNQRLQSARHHQSLLTKLVSHDLSTPLSALQGYAQLLDREQPRHPLVQKVLNLCQHMRQMIEGLLVAENLDKYAFSQPEPTALQDLLQQLQQRHQAHLGFKQQTLKLAVPENCQILTIPDLALQLLDNLLSNAIKYTPPGQQITLQATPSGQDVAVCVIDQGPGLSAEEQAQLFQAFVPLSARPTAGESQTGLGLHLAAQVAQKLQLQIEVQSTPGQGACFQVLFPAAA